MNLIKNFKRTLPPPNYMRLPSLSVDISDASVKYARFKPDLKSGQKLILEDIGSIDLEVGVVQKGEITDAAKLVETLKKLKKESKVEHVRVSLPEEKAYIFEAEIKRDTPHKEIRGILEFKLEENVPISPREAYFDYHIFDDEVDNNNMIVSVSVYSKETINKYYDVFLEAGFIPIAFEVEATAVARAVLPKGNKGTYLIVDFGENRTGLGIVHRGVLMYTSTIDIGGKQLSNALRKQLGDKAESELTIIKNEQGLVHNGDRSVYESLVPTISALKDEIDLRIQYWNSTTSKDSDRFIEQVVVCGGSSNLRGLPDYLSETLHIDTENANVWQNAFALDDFVPPIDKRHSYSYATAVGLALAPFV